jgi:chemotaxis response regulator CheB
VAEDESTCVVFGMPKEAIKLGGVDRIVPLDQIPSAKSSPTAEPRQPETLMPAH